MEADLSESDLTTVSLGNSSLAYDTAGINGTTMNYNPTAPSALGFGAARSNLNSSLDPPVVPNTRPDSLPHYNNTSSYYTNSGPKTNTMMNESNYTVTSASTGGTAMSSSFSAPNSLNSVVSPTSPTNENGNDRSTSSAPASAGLVRSNSTIATTAPANSKIENIRNWSISTYKCTRQLLAEKLGKSSRTVDTELEASIEALRDTQKKYAQVLRLARALASHFYHVVSTQHQLGDVFADLAQKSPELQEEFIYNSETQRTLSRNGETLMNALNFFVSSVNTLCNKTMEDTLATIKQYEQARIEYDAYRTDLEVLSSAPRTQVSSIKLDEAQRNFTAQKNIYDQLRSDVAIKLKFLNENKVKVMHKQLLLFHNAVSAYFTGNETQLEAALKQFNIRPKPPNTAPPSWLEQTIPELLLESFESLYTKKATENK